jgi:hypothetical protein
MSELGGPKIRTDAAILHGLKMPIRSAIPMRFTSGTTDANTKHQTAKTNNDRTAVSNGVNNTSNGTSNGTAKTTSNGTSNGTDKATSRLETPSKKIQPSPLSGVSTVVPIPPHLSPAKPAVKTPIAPAVKTPIMPPIMPTVAPTISSPVKTPNKTHIPVRTVEEFLNRPQSPIINIKSDNVKPSPVPIRYAVPTSNSNKTLQTHNGTLITPTGSMISSGQVEQNTPNTNALRALADMVISPEPRVKSPMVNSPIVNTPDTAVINTPCDTPKSMVVSARPVSAASTYRVVATPRGAISDLPKSALNRLHDAIAISAQLKRFLDSNNLTVETQQITPCQLEPYTPHQNTPMPDHNLSDNSVQQTPSQTPRHGDLRRQLHGYVVVAPKYYNMIMPGDQVRWISAGKLLGGIIDVVDSRDDAIFLTIVIPDNSIIELDTRSVAAIYKRSLCYTEIAAMQTLINGQNRVIEGLKTEIQQLRDGLAAMQTKPKRGKKV